MPETSRSPEGASNDQRRSVGFYGPGPQDFMDYYLDSSDVLNPDHTGTDEVARLRSTYDEYVGEIESDGGAPQPWNEVVDAMLSDIDATRTAVIKWLDEMVPALLRARETP